jgi:hypothetical protein
MARARLPDGEGHQMWSVAANILKKSFASAGDRNPVVQAVVIILTEIPSPH